MLIMSDNAVRALEDDAWGLVTSSDDLLEMIVAATSLPLTVGVFGSWGSGKTSLLQLMRCRAAERSDELVTVWFDAWKFERRAEVLPALVRAVLTSLEQAAPDKTARQRVAACARAASRIFAGRAVQVVTQGAVRADEVDALLARLAQDQDDRADARYASMAGFDEIFDDIANEVLGDRRLVVLVDDLDRCAPLSALSVLEGIKHFMGSRSAAFVIALDIDSLITALSALEPRDMYYRRHYVEKLIQVAHYVPAPDPARLQAMLQASSGLAMTPPLWKLVLAASEANPRRAKRFVNTLLLARAGAVGDPDTAAIERLRLAQLLAMRVLFPDFYRQLADDPQLWPDLDQSLRSGDRRAPSHVDDRLRRFLADAPLVRFLRSVGPDSDVPLPRAPGSAVVAELLAKASVYGPTLVSMPAPAPTAADAVARPDGEVLS